MPVPLTIRLASPSDAIAIAALNAVLGYPTPADRIPDRLQRLTASPAATALVAEAEGEVVGIITAMLVSSIHDDAPIAWITTLVVATEMQGRGVGRQLVAAAESWAHAGGAKRISVTSRTHRLEAHRFYEGLGYEKTGVRLGKTFSKVS
ncbi:MAG: GNAT family N-acetyltransferase [bacterium]